MDADVQHAVRGELVRQQDEARKTVQRGVVLIALVPCAIIMSVFAVFASGAFAALLAIVIAGLYALVGGVAGISLVAVGLAEHRKLTHQLRELDEPRKLPEARLLLR